LASLSLTNSPSPASGTVLAWQVSACIWPTSFSLLSNLFLLLMGFALLSRHFEESAIPDQMPALLPDDWKGGLVLLVMVFVLSSFLDNIAGGDYWWHGRSPRVSVASPYRLSRSHRGCVERRGLGSVVGDTTTTMMWVSGVSALSVLEAYCAAIVALALFAVPASLQQQRYSPITKHARKGLVIDWTRVFIVAAILVVALAVNIVTNLRFPECLVACRCWVFRCGRCFWQPRRCGGRIGA
jgi:hypothetical protein